MATRSRKKRKKVQKQKPRVRGIQLPRPVTEEAPSIVPLPPVAMTAHDGEIMGSPRVIAVYWGNAFVDSTGARNAVANGLDSFFSIIFQTTYMALLNSEYGVGPGSFVGSILLPHNPATTETLSDGDMMSRLVQWLDNGFLQQKPASNERDLLFVVFVPPEVTLTQSGTSGFCGYHRSGKYGIIFGKDNLFLAALTWPGTGSPTVNLDLLTHATSHELAEAFTDRTPGRGWFDDATGKEIGDVCSFCLGPSVYDAACLYPLSSYWRQSVGRCVRQADINVSLDLNRNADGRLEVFVSMFSGVWHAWQSAPGVDNWSSGNLGTPPGVQSFSGGPSVAVNADGRLEVFIVGADGQLWHIFQSVPSNGWSSWGGLGAPPAGILSLPAIFTNADARLEAFVIGKDSALWHTWQVERNQQNDSWSGWNSLGSPSGVTLVGDPSVYINFDGRLEVFAFGSDFQVWHIWQTRASGGWSGWGFFLPPGGIEESPVVTRNASNELQFFLVSANSVVFFLNQTSPNNGWSQGWVNLSGPTPGVVPGPTVVLDNNSLLELFLVGGDGALWVSQQTSQTPSSQVWAGWNSLGNPQNPPSPPTRIAGGPAVSLNQNGLLEAVVMDNLGVLWHIWQTSPGGPWSNWEQLSQQLPRTLSNMSVSVSLVGKTPAKVTIRVTVNDSSTGAPIAGATVVINDANFNVVKASGVTAADGTATLSYARCKDPETHTGTSCPGTVSKAGYQDGAFDTPFPV